MTKKIKKLIAGALACVLMMGSTVSVFALEGTSSINSESIVSQSEITTSEQENSSDTSSQSTIISDSVLEQEEQVQSSSEEIVESEQSAVPAMEEEQPIATTDDILVVLQPVIIQGDAAFTKEKLTNAVIVLSATDEITQVTQQYELAVTDDGGYDNNTIGDYVVTFQATNKETGAILEKSETLSVQSPDDFFSANSTNARSFSSRSMPSAADTEEFQFGTSTNPAGNPAGLGISAEQSAFHGYRFAQGVRTNSPIHFYGNNTNAFYRYHAWTEQGWGVPVYCVEPLVQDKNGNGNWMGGAGWAYESVSNDNGASGNFHTVTGGWALASEPQHRVASAVSYFSRPEAMMIDGNTTQQMETYYVAAQILIWEALDGVIDTDPNSATFMEALPNVDYYDRNTASMTNGNYHNYEYSGYQACIVGNDVPASGYPTIQAYETLKQHLKDYYSTPAFMYKYPSTASITNNLIKLPSPNSGDGVQLSGAPNVLSTIDWSNFTGNTDLEVDTSTISAGYVTVKAKKNIPKTSPTISTFTKAGSSGKNPIGYFLSLYANQYAFNGEGQGQTKMTFATIDPVRVFLGFYTEDTAQFEIAKVDEKGNPILIPVTFEIYDPEGNLVDVVETSSTTGIATTKQLPLKEYDIKEKESPLGYTGLFEGKLKLTIPDEIVKVTATNTKQRLEILKVDKDNPNLVLEGAEFTISVFENGKWKLVDTITTGKDGKALTDKVYNGDKWKIDETKVPFGYADSGYTKEFAITKENTILSFTVENQKQKVEITKVDSEDKNRYLQDAEFTLYVFENGEWQEVEKNVTNQDGKATMEKLYVGRWKLRETKYPVGYKTDGWEVEFTVTEKDGVISFTAENYKNDSYGKVVFDKGGKKPKGFPQTGDIDQSEDVIETDTIITSGAEPTSNSFSQTLLKDGKEYTLKSVTYKKQDAEKVITKEVPYENLEFQKVPQTIEVEQDGKTYTLELVNADYVQRGAPIKADYEEDFGYTLNQPKAAATKTFTVTDETTGVTKEVEGTLTSIDRIEDYAWRPTPITAIFYGTAGTKGFQFGDTVIPYNESAPVYKGYEKAILDSLSLSSTSYRIVSSKWTDSGFTTVNGESARRATLTAEEYTARWVAKYSAEEDAKTEFSATATYSSNAKLKDGEVEYLATATYSPVQTTAENSPTVTTVVIVAAIVILAICLAIVFFILAKRKKENQEQENEI